MKLLEKSESLEKVNHHIIYPFLQPLHTGKLYKVAMFLLTEQKPTVWFFF